MKKLLTLSFIIIIGASSFGQIIIPKKDYVQKIRHSRYSFGICLISNMNTDVSFGIMRENPDSTHEVIFLTKSAFMRQVSGAEKSRANPDKINFFEEYDIDSKILGELWKLKHDIYPYGKELGWGTELGVPSKRQYSMLSKFGINKMTDYTFGDNIWLLLQKVNDPVWVGQYQNQK